VTEKNPFKVGDRVRCRDLGPQDAGHRLVKKGKATVVWVERGAVRVRFDEDGITYHSKIHWTRLTPLEVVEGLAELA